MATISARKIEEALSKAKDVGLVEESFPLGDISVVLRNLRPDEYTKVYEENEDKEGAAHLFGYQKSHLCRSLVEINGVNLRNIQYVEVDEVVLDPKTGEPVLDPRTNEVKTRSVKLELHEYVLKYILDTWGKETLVVAWRKFGDVLKLAEDKAKDGIKFVLPEETPEERFRRCIDDVREAMTDVPETLLNTVLEEAGLMRLSTAEELKKAMEKTDQIAREQAPAPTPAQAQAPTPPAPVPVSPPPAPAQEARVRQISVQELMARRQPLNQEAIEPPQPPAAPPGQRSQKIAEIEGLPPTPSFPTGPVAKVPAAVLDQPGRDRVDAKQFAANFDQAPRSGINPRFRAPR